MRQILCSVDSVAGNFVSEETPLTMFKQVVLSAFLTSVQDLWLYS